MRPLPPSASRAAPKRPIKPAESKNAAAADYQPAFFNAAEWAFILAACDRLIPADDIGPSAGQAGVPEFIDRHMQTPYASGDIWYMQGPFLEAAPQFGYQGRLPVRDILRVGIKAIDAHCLAHFGGKTFAQLEPADQETLLEGGGSRQAGAGEHLRQGVLQSTPERNAHGIFLRSEAWRQQEHGRLENDRLSRRARRLHQLGRGSRSSPTRCRRSIWPASAADAMAIVKPKVDAVIVGMGWTGAIMAKELTDAGLRVVALERGPDRDTQPDFAYPAGRG